MVIDLDAFTRASTSAHGEQAGDEALEAVARALSAQAQGDGPGRAARRRPVRGAAAAHRRGRGSAVVAEGLERVIAACGVDVGDERAAPVREHRLRARRRAHRERRAGAAGGRSRDARRQARRAPAPAELSAAAGALRCGEYAQRMQPDERLAVIDLGSNSFRLVVFMAGDGLVEAHRRDLRAGAHRRRADGDAAGWARSRCERALATLDVFAHFCRASGLGAGAVDAVATSAIRDAENAAEFLTRARACFGTADPRAQPRGGGPLRLPRGGQLDDAARRLRAGPRRRLAAARARRRAADRAARARGRSARCA